MTGTGRHLLRRHLRRHREALWRIAGLSLVLAVPTGLSGWMVSRALDTGFLVDEPVTGLVWLAGYAVLSLAGVLLTRWLFPHLASVVEPLRDSLVELVVRAGLDRAVVEDSSPGSDSVQATDQVEGLRVTIGAMLRNLHATVAAVAAALAGLALLEPLIALVAVPCMVSAGIGYRLLLGLSVRRYRVGLLSDEKLAESVAQAFHCHRDIAAFGAERVTTSRVLERAGIAADAWVRVGRVGLWRLAVTGLGVELPLLLLLLLAPMLRADGTLSFGSAVGALVYLTAMIGPAIRFITQGTADWLVGVATVAGRLAEATATAPDGQRSPGRGLEPARQPDLELRDVTFGYSINAEPVLREVSVTVPFGSHVAVVGPSGSGKSTLSNLLTGLRSPTSGTVHFGGALLADLDPPARHRAIALVPQQSYVFVGSVRENLTYLAPDTTDTVLAATVTRFGLEPVVNRLGGLDGRVPAGGAGLSAGERQLMTALRTYLSPASVVILDEATCHLDPAAEQQVEDMFRERSGTLIVVAHRLSSALRAEQVMLVDAGGIQIGTHQDLLRTSQRYRELFHYWTAPGPQSSGDMRCPGELTESARGRI